VEDSPAYSRLWSAFGRRPRAGGIVIVHSRPPVILAAMKQFPPGRHLWGVLVVAIAFAVVTAAQAFRLHIGLRDPGGEFFSRRLVASVVILAVLAVADATVRTRRAGDGWIAVPGVLRSRWAPGRVCAALAALVAYDVVYLCYHNLKSWDAFNAPRDALLRRADRLLFLGHSPAVVLHDLLGQHWADLLLTIVYESFSTWVPLSVVAVLAFADRIRDAYVFVASAMWVWILGVVTYYLIPSIGPFWSSSRQFAGLPHTIITSTQSRFVAERLYLLQHPADGDAFSQLAAFASLHVGFTCMTLLVLRHYGFRRAARLMTGYLALVMVATVYLGWHFATDLLGGVAVACVAVLLGRLTVDPRGVRGQVSRHSAEAAAAGHNPSAADIR
jgi:PAP2 superfamily